ncbi:hypothetical protein A3G62_01875 [Candidatus Kaiserbacteria bacterium RIFCSPLOWO2_12_FULL_50_10]|nr:MAG: hypothetical protein A3G62_01875 [Candidatus Kaiserbacteria bacterium RIFCSPLOWO2_12_FULL_50_10]
MWFAEVRATTKRGYGGASVAVRAEKRATKSDKLIVLFSETETAKQNQKFPFHFFFRFAAEGWGEETREKCKEIFWFLHTRVRERVRGALVRFSTQSERTRQFQVTTRSARAKWVRAKANTSPHVPKNLRKQIFCCTYERRGDSNGARRYTRFMLMCSEAKHSKNTCRRAGAGSAWYFWSDSEHKILSNCGRIPKRKQ